MNLAAIGIEQSSEKWPKHGLRKEGKLELSRVAEAEEVILRVREAPVLLERSGRNTAPGREPNQRGLPVPEMPNKGNQRAALPPRRLLGKAREFWQRGWA